MVSHHPDDAIRKSAPILRTGVNRDFGSETKKEKRMKTIVVQKKNAAKSVNIRKKIYSTATPEKKKRKENNIYDFKIESKTITKEMCQQREEKIPQPVQT